MDGTPTDTTSADTSTGATIDDILAGLPGSRDAVNLFAAVLRIMTEGVDDGDADTRPDRIQTALEQATSEGRTRALVLCTTIGRLCDQLYNLTLQVKGDRGDLDVLAASAIVTPDGWLLVTLDGVDVARLPFGPERDGLTAQRMADDLLHEYVSLHIGGGVEAIAFTGDVLAGRREVDEAPPASSRPDPIPVRQLRPSRTVQ